MQGIGKALLDGDSAAVDNAVDLETLRYAVGKVMFCQKTGMVLDVRTAVMVTAGKDGEQPMTRVVTGEVWDSVAAEFMAGAENIGARVQVLDGREMHRRRRG